MLLLQVLLLVAPHAVVFNDCNEAVLNYGFPGAGFSGEMSLKRAASDNVLLDQVLTAP